MAQESAGFRSERPRDANTLDTGPQVCEDDTTAERGRLTAQRAGPGPGMGGRNVQRSVRRLTRVVMLGAIAAFAAVPLLATSASAQSSGDAVCTFNVLPNPIPPPFPAAVHIEGTAPSGTEVTA